MLVCIELEIVTLQKKKKWTFLLNDLPDFLHPHLSKHRTSRNHKTLVARSQFNLMSRNLLAPDLLPLLDFCIATLPLNSEIRWEFKFQLYPRKLPTLTKLWFSHLQSGNNSTSGFEDVWNQSTYTVLCTFSSVSVGWKFIHCFCKHWLITFQWQSQASGNNKMIKIYSLSKRTSQSRCPFRYKFSSVQFSLSVVSDSTTPCTAAHQASMSITNSRSPPKPMSIVSVMPSNHLILCCPLLLLPSILPSIRVFSNESALHIRWPKFGVSASTSVIPMNTQGWSPIGWTGWISLQSKGLSRVFSNTTVQKHQFFGAQLSL